MELERWKLKQQVHHESPSARVAHLKLTYHDFRRGGIIQFSVSFLCLGTFFRQRRLKFEYLKSPIPRQLPVSLPPHRVL